MFQAVRRKRKMAKRKGWVYMKKPRLSHKPSTSFYRYLIGHMAAPSSKGGQGMSCCVWATNCGFIRKEGENRYWVKNCLPRSCNQNKIKPFASPFLQSLLQQSPIWRKQSSSRNLTICTGYWHPCPQASHSTHHPHNLCYKPFYIFLSIATQSPFLLQNKMTNKAKNKAGPESEPPVSSLSHSSHLLFLISRFSLLWKLIWSVGF